MNTNKVAEFISSRPGLNDLVGSKLDNAQYISLLFKGEAERIKDKVMLGHIHTPAGRRYHIAVAGQPLITTHTGQPVTHPGELKLFLDGGRETAINYDTLAHFEVEGETPAGKKYIGIYFSLADAKLHIAEESEKGEL